VKLTENECSALRAWEGIPGGDSFDWRALNFTSVAGRCDLPQPLIRRTVRALARKGLLAYERALWNDDGPAGAGYRITESGMARLDALVEAEEAGRAALTRDGGWHG
jgi:hypothetical protein